MAEGILTLLTDFGFTDVYVGLMKGIIATINPALAVIDLTHQIPAQHVEAARFNLLHAFPYFPARTVHVAVVDPGVGGPRRPIALACGDSFLVGPDNGLFSGVLEKYPATQAVVLTNQRYWQTPNPSSTFHGRDIFAPVGAYLASGVTLDAFGPPVDPVTLIHFPSPGYKRTESTLQGCVQYVDQFGNLVTNIPAAAVVDTSWAVMAQQLMIPSYRTYSESPANEPLALIGSHGWVEVAVNGGNAQYQLRLTWGDGITVLFNNPAG